MVREKIIVCWSGGKDSTLMLHALKESHQYDIQGLLTTMTEGYDRISMHGVRNQLLEAQAEALGLPLFKVYITQNATNAEYEEKMGKMMKEFVSQGITRMAFGDIFLEDLKIYREKNLAKVGMKGVFPIWKQNTLDLVRRFIKLGYKGRLACVDMKALDESFAGRELDDRLVQDLPSEVDPCGENGEFHSFVTDGPVFKKKVECEPGEIRKTDRFCFRDLVPVKEN